MTYRDESDALRSRVTQLERELEDAKANVAKLEGRSAVGAVGARVERSRVSGGPSRYERVVELPYEIAPEGYEAIADLLRARLGLTNVSQVGRSLTSPGVFSLVARDGVTRIELRMDWRAMAGGVVAVGIMASLLAALPGLAITLELATHGGSPSAPFHLLWLLPGVGAAAAGALRRRTAHLSERGLTLANGVFETVLQLADRHALRAPKARVDISEAADDEAAEASDRTGERSARQP